MILRWYKKFSNDHDLDDSIVFIFSIKKKERKRGQGGGEGTPEAHMFKCILCGKMLPGLPLAGFEEHLPFFLVVNTSILHTSMLMQTGLHKIKKLLPAASPSGVGAL